MEGGRERLKFLGACGMFTESFRVISARKKLFSHITLAFILPLSFFILVESIVADLILGTYDHPGMSFGSTDGVDGTFHNRTYVWPVFLAIKVVYYTVVMVLSLLATSAVAYAAACHYASRDTALKEVAKAVLVPAVWKRLIVTFLWIYLIVIVFNLIFAVLIFSCALLLVTAARPLGIVLIAVLFIAYLVAAVYISIVSELALVGSVLEDAVYGREAISKSRALLKGKLCNVVGCLVLLVICYGVVGFGFGSLMAVGILAYFVAGAVFLFVLAFEHLVLLVAVTVCYLVCKSYHAESVDTSHLAGGPREAAKDVQLEMQDRV